MAPLQKLASEHGISILVIDHMRKMESEDPIDMISGSVGKTGAVDGFLLLYRKRGETDARLYVIGRDIEEETELLLSFSQECASWVVKGDTDDSAIASSPQQQEILDELSKYPQGLTVKVLAESLGKNVNTTRNLLLKLRTAKKVTLANNVYCVVTHSNRSNHSKDSNHSNIVNEPASLPHTVEEEQLTTLTTVTTPYYANGHNHAKQRDPMPSWLREGTWDYKKFLETHSLADVNERRATWLAQQSREAVLA